MRVDLVERCIFDLVLVVHVQNGQTSAIKVVLGVEFLVLLVMRGHGGR